MTDRVIVLVDMDCFYCQVEAKLDPTLIGKPVAVVQYNAWKGGGIIAVNYEARDKGVSRGMRGNDAKKHCPEIELVSVATVRDKADLTKYRDASREVISVLCTYSNCVERASIDEAYLDLTESIKQKQPCVNIHPNQINNTFIVGYSKEKCNNEDERQSGTAEWINDVYCNGLNDEANKNLAIAASIVEEIRLDVYNKTGYRCSAGIAHNKILAKLACGLHKPNRQTVLPHSSVPHLYQSLSIKKVRHLGGKLGDHIMEEMNCSVMADLLKYSEKELIKKFDEKTGLWLYNIARGIDGEAVKSRLVPKSIGCCKRFPGKTSLQSKQDVSFWLGKLTEELTERILEDQTMNKRKAQLLTVSMTLSNHQATSKSIPLAAYDYDRIYNTSYLAIQKIVYQPKQDIWSPIFCLGLSASKFMDKPTSGGISDFFQPGQRNTNCNSDSGNNKTHVNSSTAITSNSFFSKYITNLPPSPTVTSSIEAVETANNNIDRCSELDKNNSLSEASINSATPINIMKVDDSTSKSHINRNSGSIKSFFMKQVDSETNLNHTVGKVKTSPNYSISGFLRNKSENEIINPLDVFPDLSVIDDEMLQSFPIAFRRRVLELKKAELESNSKVNDKKADNILLEKPSCSNSVNLVSNLNPTHKEIYDNEDIFDTDEIPIDSSPPELRSKYFASSVEKCSECGEEIGKDSYMEHLDFHLAEKVSREINPLALVTASIKIPISKQTVAASKRKQPGKRKKTCDSKKLKTLKTFFPS